MAQAQDVFSRALRSDDLDVSVKIILEALGLESVGVGCEFSQQDRDTYFKLLNSYRRAVFLRGWLSDELDQAAERVGANG